MGQALRYRDASALPESIRTRLAKRFANQPARAPTAPPRQPRKPRADVEHSEQVVFFNRIRALAANKPARYAVAAARTHAIPNGGGRSRAEAGRLKAEGVKKGVSDVFVSFPVGDRHGCYIEMKAPKGRVSPEQAAWLGQAQDLGYVATVCYGADEALAAWKQYVDGWLARGAH
ncbi:MAG: VRR-NUC domain-containing protein [Rhodanobacteraceae bacterium]